MRTRQLSVLEISIYSSPLCPVMLLTSPMYIALTLNISSLHGFIVVTSELSDIVGYCTSRWLMSR